MAHNLNLSQSNCQHVREVQMAQTQSTSPSKCNTRLIILHENHITMITALNDCPKRQTQTVTAF